MPGTGPNETLRALMAQHGFSHNGLADAICTTSQWITAKPVSCTGRQIRRLLSGEIAWPGEAYRAALEEVFGVPSEKMGFVPSAGYRSRVRAKCPQTPPCQQEQPVQRRQFIVSFGSLIALPSLPESGRLGMNDIVRIREAEGRLMRLDRQYGGSTHLVDVAGRYIAHVEEAMRRCTYGEKVQTQLHQALGEMYAQAGWLAYDSSQHDQARRMWDTGLRYALLARDTVLQARIWASLSRQAVDLGHGAEAVYLARTALDATRNNRPSRMSVLLHSRVALGHSVQGERGRCGQSLHRAEQQLDRAAEQQAPPWLAFCGPDELAGLAALCFHHLGDHPKAVQASRESLDLTRADDFQRNAFATHVGLARDLIAAGEADGALEAGMQALELLPEVTSPRWGAQLAQVHKDLRDRVPKQARDFSERYREVTT